METLVVVAQHRNHCYGGRAKGNNPARFGSSPSRGFRDINCRTFATGYGLLASPFKGCGSPVLDRALSSPNRQTRCANTSTDGKSKGEDARPSKKIVNSSPIPINWKDGGKKQRLSRDNLSFSELWAGPAYSNSPPPSSLPMPKFSLKPKRTVSLELPVPESDLDLQLTAKSAPASPARETACPSVDFLGNDDSATKMLRRILNLDIADD